MPSGLICPKCGAAELVYQEMLSASCERCPSCAWLSLGYGHSEVARMCREAARDRLAANPQANDMTSPRD